MPIPEIFSRAVAEMAGELESLYRDFHSHPELSMMETRTAGIVADRLRGWGWEVTEGVGGTGVVGVLRNGDWPKLLLRADMDALPVKEETGLDYASTVVTMDRNGEEMPAMHACGHDTHVTCLLGACSILAGDMDAWRGTIVAVFQPGEEIGAGAEAMIADGFFDRFGVPDVCLAQHVTTAPAGHVVLGKGANLSAADSFRIRVFGRGGHGSLPHRTVDPVVIAASIVMRLQTVVSRFVSPMDIAVVTVGALHSGTKDNVIPDDAELVVNVRTYDPDVRRTVFEAIERIVQAEATASGATKPPDIEHVHGIPRVVNDSEATERVRTALADELGAECVHENPPDPGSEDFGVFGQTAGVPSVFWFWGGHDPAHEARYEEPMSSVMGETSQHSPVYAPVIDPTLQVGVRCWLAVVLDWAGRVSARQGGTACP